MNRKQRRAAARKKNVAAMGDIAGAQEDIGRARTLYLSALPGAGGAGNGAGGKARGLVRRWLDKNPRLWGDVLGLAVDLVKGGKWEDAMNTFQDIVEVCSGDADALAKTGLVLFHYGRSKEAEEVLSRAVELDPSQAVASNNLGSLYLCAGRPADAVVHFKNAQAARPELVEPYINLCSTLAQMDDWDQAKIFADMTFELADYSPAISPNLRKVYRGICDFEGLRKLGDLWQDCEHIETRDLASVFLGSLVYADDAGSIRHLRDLVLRWAQDVEKRAAAAPLPARAKGGKRVKLRVGILSADLCDSSVARFLTPLMRNYDRQRFEIYCYTPYHRHADPIQNLYRKSVDKFTFVDGMKEREVAAAIQADDIDILLELNGFTRGSRLESTAYKPAPVQMSWLGYPFTCGLKAIDYVIMDRFVKPADEGFLVEEPLIMPEGWVCFGNFPDVEIAQGLPADRNGWITFGTLNNPYKFNPEMIALWAQVMNRVPDSRFLLVRAQASSRSLRGNLTEEFARHGVSADRLSFFDNRHDRKSHLSHYNGIDISLDTYPLTGGTTTCEATWMGVPVVTLVGESFHQRLSYTMLMNCGLEEFCTFTAEDFVDRAVKLAGDRDKLLAWRHGLRDVMRQSPLCDEERFLFEFQDMLEQVAALHGLRGTPASAMAGQGGG